jgi:hypothetical protein
LIASLVKGEKRKMPIKLKPSQTVRDKKTGKMVTEHDYIKIAALSELIELLEKDNFKPKVKQKIRNEIKRREKLNVKSSNR